MQHNEQPPPTPDEITRLTAEIRSKWTAKEEYERRVVKGDVLHVETVVVPLGQRDDVGWLASA